MKKIILNLLVLFSAITSSGKAAVYPTDSMDVFHYNIDLDMVHLSKKSLSGYTELRFKGKYPSQSNWYFDLLELQVDSVLINGQPRSFQYNDTVIVIPVGHQNNPVDTTRARIYYHGQPVVESANWGGFHFLNDSSLAFNLGIAFKAKPHNYGKVWFPCADNFTDRATYEFHISTKNSQRAVCSGSLDSISTHGNSTKTWHWSLKQTIPAYLASIAVSDFAVVKDTYHGQQQDIPTYLHVAPWDSTDAMGSFTNLNDILSTYEQRFGPYRWPRAGYVGTTKGAMEHATSIAYPRHCIDGSLNCESLLAHELSHHWFGDLVTCETAEDMWLNEGWAVFCEAIYKEGVYGADAYKNYMRSKLHEVIRTAHVSDNGYRALYGIPHEYTYGATVYDKGATVVHSLRNYLGDSLFFNTIRAYLDTFAFSHASTNDMNQFINQHSGVNVDGFFNAWVYRPGFSNFSIDSFSVKPIPGAYHTKVYLKQRLVGTSQYANDNRIELGFVTQDQKITYQTMTFSGKDTMAALDLINRPVEIFVDPREKLSDATTDQYQTIKAAGNYLFNDTYCEIDVQNIQDSALLQITHHWIMPEDTSNVHPPLYHLSGRRYWKVDGVIPAGFHAKASFEYKKFGNLDGDLITSVYDSLSILYKKEKDDPWRPVSYTQSGSVYSGKLTADTLKKGYYVLGKFDKSLGNLNSSNNKKSFEVRPNPANDYIEINKNNNQSMEAILINSNGQIIKDIHLEASVQQSRFSISELDAGMYFIMLIDQSSRRQQIEKIVIQR